MFYLSIMKSYMSKQEKKKKEKVKLSSTQKINCWYCMVDWLIG